MKKKELAVILKGYPRVDEIFIVQELVELERRGHKLIVFSLIKPEDNVLQSIHQKLKAPVVYVPRYKRSLRTSFLRAFLKNPLRLLETWLLYRRQALSHEHTIKRFMQALWIDCYLSSKFSGVIYTHFINAPSIVGMGLAHFRELPWLAFAHAKDIYAGDPGILRLRLFEAHTVFSCNKESVQYLSKVHSRVRLVYHGILPENLMSKEIVEAKRAPRFIMMGRLVAKKGHLFLLEVLRNLKKSGVDFQCYFYGEGELRGEIESRIANYQLEQNVTLYGAYRLDEISLFISKGDLYLSPCLTADDGDRDGVPNTMLEAMYLGCVVVSHKTSAITEVLREGKNGYFVAPDISSWVSKLKYLVSKDHSQISQMARQTVEERFLFSHCVEELTDTFDRV